MWSLALFLGSGSADSRADANTNSLDSIDRQLRKVVLDSVCSDPMEPGPDGCLYIIEFGTAWEHNKHSQIVRVESAAVEENARHP